MSARPSVTDASSSLLVYHEFMTFLVPIFRGSPNMCYTATWLLPNKSRRCFLQSDKHTCHAPATAGELVRRIANYCKNNQGASDYVDNPF
jgi:hypothetical protein